MIKFITEKCENVDSPFRLKHLAKDFIHQFKVSRPLNTIRARIKSYCREIRRLHDLDTLTKVKQLFGLSVPVDTDYLDELRKDALVEVDEQNRISHYKANDGSLELSGDHSLSAKQKAGVLESKRCHLKLIRSYFKNNDDSDEDSRNEKEKEMRILMKFIREKCENVESPFNLCQLAKDFITHFGVSRPRNTILNRINSYCREIQKLEHLDTLTKVKQLFGLSVPVDTDYLEELRKDAVVDVDKRNRITKYKANDGSLILQGKHSSFAKRKSEHGSGKAKSVFAARKKEKSLLTDDTEDEGDNEGLDDDSDEYSSEEFDSEFDSDDEDHLNEPEDLLEPLDRVDDLEYETPVRRRSPSDMKAGDEFNDNPSRSHRSEATEIREDAEKKHESRNVIQKEEPDKTRSVKLLPKRKSSVQNREAAKETDEGGNKMSTRGEREDSNDVTTRSGRVSKKRVLDVNFSQDQVFSAPSPKTPKSSRNADAKESSDDSMKPDELDDNNSIDSSENPLKVELQPFRGRILDNEHLIERDEDIRRIQKPYSDIQIPRDNTQNVEAPIKNKYEVVPVKEEIPIEEVKPKLAHNSKIQFLDTLQSLILFLDNPLLSQIQLNVIEKIREMEGSEEVIQNNEAILSLEFLIARMTNHSSSNLSETTESVSLREFLCHLKAAILNSKMMGLDLTLDMIKKQIKDPASKDQSVPMENVARALQATLGDICY